MVNFPFMLAVLSELRILHCGPSDDMGIRFSLLICCSGNGRDLESCGWCGTFFGRSSSMVKNLSCLPRGRSSNLKSAHLIESFSAENVIFSLIERLFWVKFTKERNPTKSHLNMWEMKIHLVEFELVTSSNGNGMELMTSHLGQLFSNIWFGLNCLGIIHCLEAIKAEFRHPSSAI